MQHIKPLGKGDPLCPLGFHPQVRWPTRCKRCFRDYKEHGNRNKSNDSSLRRDETTLSTPSLSSWTSRNREEKSSDSGVGSRTWTSSSNLSSTNSNNSTYKSSTEDLVSSRFGKTASSWTSSPNLVNLKEDTHANTIPTVNITLQKRRSQTLDTGQDDTDDYRRTAYTVRRRTTSSLPLSNSSYRDTTPTRDRVRTSPVSTSPAVTTPAKTTTKADVDFVFHVKKEGKPPIAPRSTNNRISQPPASSSSSSTESSEEESDDDKASIANTETTDTTLVNDSELQEQVDSLKKELEIMKARCERVEKEKSDILLRRLASLDTVSTKTSSSEVLKLQQRVNELQSTVEDLRDDKKSLNLKVMELEADLEKAKELESHKKESENLRSKLQAAETLCEELMDENEDMKKELRDLEEEMDEMQDNFRDEQADEYSSLKKELEQTAKNCRILSFKLRKAERKAEQMEAEKLEAEKKYREVAGGQAGLDKAERIRHLEQQLVVANEVSQRLQKELEEANAKLKSANNSEDKTAPKKKAPMLGAIGKSLSGEKVSRESLTRGGSQEDPVQLLRDLQDSMEREADLREQLRYAEEEAQNLRKKASRVEDDNESLVLQLKKMATKARTHRSSPTPSRLTPEPPVEKDEGISDEEDPAELRLLLELNEQEAAVLRRKVEELEGEGDNLKKKVKELQDKLTAKTATANRRAQIHGTEPTQSNAIYDQKIKVLEEEMNELRKKLLEKERDCERLHTELSLSQKKPKVLQKAKSLDGDQHTLDLKRQLQVVEQEASVLRSRNQTLEFDNEKLTAENKKLLLTQRTKKTAQERAASLDMKLKLSDLEKKLEEANKKLMETEENKTSPGIKKSVTESSNEVEKVKTQLSKAEAENKKLTDTLKRLKEEAVSDILQFYQKRTPKKPTDITTKLQMKKMVNDLENEIGEMLVALRKSESERKKATEGSKKDSELEKLKTEIENLKKTLETTQKEFKDEKAKLEKEQEKLQKDIKVYEDGKKQVEVEKDKIIKKLEEEKKKLEDSKKKLEKNNTKLEADVEKIKAELRDAKSGQDEATILAQRAETLKSNLREQKEENETLSKQLEVAKKTEQELTKLNKEVSEKSKKLTEVEKKLKESEDKLKKSERLVNVKKEKITKLEKELESSKEVQKKDSSLWDTEKDKLVSLVEELKLKSVGLQEQLANKKGLVEKLEKSLQEEREKATDINVKAGSAAAREINQLREELTAAQTNAQNTTKKLSTLENEKTVSEKAHRETTDKVQKEIRQWEIKVSDLEMDLSAERKLTERLKATHDKEIKNKDEALTNLKSKAQLVGGKKAADIKEYQAKIDKLEMALASEKREYDELTAKYELLEEEHVVTKSKLVMDRENIQGQLVASQRELVSVEADLRTLRETYNSKQDTWIKEKLDLQEKMRELEEKTGKINGASETWQLEKTRLIAISDEKSSQIDQLRKDSQTQLEQIDHMRKEIEDYRQQLDDYTKVSKAQRSMTADSSAMEKEIRELKNRLFTEERSRKSELAAQKLRYEKRVSVITDELTNIQGQVARFKRERDTFRHMLESSQKNMAELKAAGNPTKVAGQTSEEVEELKNQVSTLEQQISCMEDELSEARLESSRLKTELVSEHSSWEIKISELTSKLNEMEEDRLLNSGRTRVVGLKSKIELAWQKEREDQHRLLQETSTLARDLRQTLFEVERERDKERLEAKRRHDQLKKTMEEEQEENRKKIHEMQCDLLELRDAHAKLRTTNEKLRREKDRIDKEREVLKFSSVARRRVDQEENHRVTAILQLVDELMVLAPELFPTKPAGTALALPTPPARRKGKSRESSPATERSSSKEPSPSAPDKSQQLQAILQRLTEATDELRRGQRAVTEDREKARTFITNRRAGSTESDNPLDSAVSSRGIKKTPSLYRKSLSLEQTSATASPYDQIWKDDTEGSLNSIQSLDETRDNKMHSLQRRDPSLDSRLSGGSTQSEVIPSTADKKKKKGLFGKLKKLTKTRSVDEDSDYVLHSSSQYDHGSDTSIGSAAADTDTRSSKRDLKGRLTGMFKKSGSTSRGSSLERNQKPPTASSVSGLHDSQDTLQRSTARSTTNVRTSPSPARSDVGQSSSISRPLGSNTSTNVPHKIPPNSAPLQRKVVKK